MAYHGEHCRRKQSIEFFFSGFPPKIPTRAFHSSEESIYGAAELQQQQQQPLKENPIVKFVSFLLN